MITSPVPSSFQRRLVKNLPGQPPSGATLPSRAPGAAAKIMPQLGALGAASFQRPAIPRSGVDAAEPPNGSLAQPARSSAMKKPPAARTIIINFRLESILNRDV